MTAAPSSRVWTPNTPAASTPGSFGRTGTRAGRDHEVVEALRDGLAGVEVAGGHPPRIDVDRLDLGAHPQVDPGLAVILGGARHQVRVVVDVARDPVRDAAGGVRHVRAALERDDRQAVALEAQRLGRRAHPRGVAADHHHALGHPGPLSSVTILTRGRPADMLGHMTQGGNGRFGALVRAILQPQDVEGSAGVVGSTAVAGSVGVLGSVAVAGSAGVVGSVATSGSAGVVGSVATSGSAGVVGSVATLLSAGIRRCVGCVGCINCRRCLGCVGCVGCVDCIGCVGCVGLRGAVGVRGKAA